MATRYIDRTPPMQTGNTAQDIKAALDYLAYLREQMNYILSLLAKASGEDGR